MAPMKPGPLLIYEIPDAGGQGHRLLVPHGCDIPADEAAALIASIRGPVHLAADRLGVVRPSTQRSRGGAIRDSSVVALIAGINAKITSSRTVVAALATLEDSLDAVIAEAADAVSVNDSPVIASRAAAKVLDSIVALGFREQHVAQVGPTEGDEPEPRPTRFMAALPHFAGMLAVFATGIGLGWAAAVFEAWNPPACQVANPSPNESAAETGTAGDDTTLQNETSGGSLSSPVTPPAHSTDIDVRPDEPEPRPVAVQEPRPETPIPPPPLAPQPDAANSGTALIFSVECEGIAANEQILLLRSEGNRPIGREHVANSKGLSFDETVTDGISNPEQLKVCLREAPRSFFGIDIDPPPHVSQQLTREPDSDKYSCVIEFTPANAIYPRRIKVTVTPRKSTER